MSEPRFEMLDSYARELDREADLIVPPVSAPHVRRVGTNRRRRRLVALVVVLVALALAVGGVVLANLTSRTASPNWATTPSTSVSDSPLPSTPTRATLIPSSAIDRLLPFTVSAAVFAADSDMLAPFDPSTTMSGDPSSLQCGDALNGSFVSGTRAVAYRRTGAAPDRPDWGYAIAYSDATSATAATRSLTRALTVVCTPVDTRKPVTPRTDGVEVLVYDITVPTENGAKSVYVIRDRNVVVYHVDGLGLDANAVASAVSARLDQVATAAASATSEQTSSASARATATPSRTSSASSTAAAVVTLAAPLELKTAAQINAVTWMPSAAKTFLVSELARVRAATGCSTDYLVVQAYRGSDLISGSTAGCDSAQVTWGDLAGTWKVVFGGQAVPACTEVRSSGWKSTIPSDFAGGQCYDPSGNVVAYTP